ncbi:SET [Glarea lozoyensis ATCC 20868]|uniref:SET n=1 Tax=Glarea lozoyensis (strain ATCC 20868 / MF5171) TaxID=1116229 RepID=S3E6D4_GLAL2|nr:SET [Glarea lozoyensis ATCC 20868]EPE33933.1 SET [Glarea lozoyensis ATCC 20868]
MSGGIKSTDFDFEQWLTKGDSGWKKKYQKFDQEKSKPNKVKLQQTRSCASSVGASSGRHSTQSSPTTSFSSSFLDRSSTLPTTNLSIPTTSSDENEEDGPPAWEINYSISARPQFDPTFRTEYFEVRSSQNKGLGAFAMKNISKGTCIMEEPPLFRGNFDKVYHEYHKLTEEEADEYLSLHAWTGSSRRDTQKISCIFATNRFRMSEDEDGIFLKCSRFNHSCHPFATCTYEYDEETDRLRITALRDIKAGEEITISYTRDASSLYDNYGFNCDCPACKAQPATGYIFEATEDSSEESEYKFEGSEDGSEESEYNFGGCDELPKDTMCMSQSDDS